jgi:hypothetical protein
VWEPVLQVQVRGLSEQGPGQGRECWALGPALGREISGLEQERESWYSALELGLGPGLALGLEQARGLREQGPEQE